MELRTDRPARRLPPFLPVRLRVAELLLHDPRNARRKRRLPLPSRRIPAALVAASPADRRPVRRSVDLSLPRSVVAVSLFNALPARHAAALLRRRTHWTMARTSAQSDRPRRQVARPSRRPRAHIERQSDPLHAGLYSAIRLARSRVRHSRADNDD